MEVILREDIPRLGKAGDVLKVSSGYARNFLLPRKKAIEATESALKALAQEKVRQEKRLKKDREDAIKAKEKLDSLTLTIPQKVGDQDKLFGAVTSEDIVEALKREGFSVDRKKVLLDEPIKSLGIFTVPVKFLPDVEATIRVHITKEG